MIFNNKVKNNLLSWLLYVIFLYLPCVPAAAIPSYQCEQNGKIIYQPFPCATADKLPAQIKQHTDEQDLIVFSKQADEAKVYQLLSQGISANAKDEQHNSALFYALDRQHYSIARLLINFQANVNFILANGLNLLMYCAEKGDSQAVQLLLENSAQLEEKDAKNGNTALAIAAQARQLQVAKILLAAGANPNTVNSAGLTPIILALANNSSNIVMALLENKADVDQLSHPQGKNISATPLIHFATYGDERSVLTLLQHGAKVNLANEQNISPLAAAALVGDYNTVKLLLSRGANPKQVIAEPQLWQHIQNQRNSKIAELISNAH